MSIRLLTLQLLLAIAVANARNDPPPSSDRTWSPANLPNYERDLAEQRFKTAPGKAWKAYTDFKTALRKQDSAAKLVIALQNAFDAVLESYKQGLSTYPEIVSAAAKSGLRTKRESRHAIRNLYDGQRTRAEHGRLGAATPTREQLDPYRGENETNNFEIRWCYPGAARRLLRCGADGQPPFTDYRSSRLLFSGMDGLHC